MTKSIRRVVSRRGVVRGAAAAAGAALAMPWVTTKARAAGQRGTGVETTLEDGRYLARAELNGQAGSLEFDYAQDGDTQLFEVMLSDAVTLDAEAQVEPGAALPVIWTGPNATGDYIAISPAGGAISDIDSYARTQLGSPADMAAPLVAGDGDRGRPTAFRSG